MPEKVFIIGATGKVGRELTRQFFERGDTSSRHANRTIVFGVASSSSYLVDGAGLGHEACADFASKKREGTSHNGIPDLIRLLRSNFELGNELRVIDLTASEKMLDLHKAVIGRTTHTIVTANKLPLAQCTYEEFQFLTKEPRRYGYRCSVMAGADSVPFLRELRDLGERPIGIEGCFSGTLGYITSELEKDRKFSEIVAEARDKGYTEPNPAADLSGKDVASKILILARSAGIAINIGDIKLTPFVPQEYLNDPDPEKLLVRLSELDGKMGTDVLDAQRRWEKLRYVAKFSLEHGAPAITVGPKFLNVEHPLAQLGGTVNKVIIRSGPYGSNGGKPYSIEAPGAGIDITARNIRRDLLYQIEKWEIA